MVPSRELPATIGRYQIQAEIGRGAMGVVYRALDPALNRPVALKTVHLAFPGTVEDHATFEARFLAEARAVAGLSHPGIVTIHDVGRDEPTSSLYIAFELLEGRTLAQIIDGAAPLDWREAVGLALSVAGALELAHQRGIVHRDVKPANVMRLASGQTKVMDFGVAKVSTENFTATGQFLGTPAYMSPEQLSGERVDGRSDIFSLGVVLYGLLTGVKPFEGGSVPATLGRVLHHEPVPPSRLAAGVPPSVDALVRQALAKDRQRRPDAAAFVRAAREALARPDHVPAAARPALSPRHRRWAGYAAAGAIVIAAIAAVAGFGPRAFAPLAPLASLAPPASLEVDLEHPLRSGTLKVWVDGELVAEEELESRVTGDLFVVKLRAGRERKTLQVPSGEREVRVEVEGDGFRGSRTISATFDAGATRKLVARVEGLPGVGRTRALSVWWAPS